jgi:hypothetical protein
MARLHTSFVLGYHGCSQKVGEAILAGSTSPKPSDRDYDWLGPGVYFWESDPQRAWEWADWRVSRGECDQAFVFGAVIDLGNCLDLLARESLTALAASYQSFKFLTENAADARVLPVNKAVGEPNTDLLLRYLDCAVIRHLHQAVFASGLGAFDTVRGLFTEGAELFDGSGFKAKTHIQIAVCDPKSLKGVFRVGRPA